MSAIQGQYLSRSWAMLRRDKGWIKPLFAMAAASLVPIVGWLGVYGYALEWARLTAWGVDSSPKQKDVNIGECIVSGFRGAVAAVGYMFIAVIATSLLGLFPFIGPLVSFVINLALGVIVSIAALRTTIYQKISAGYQFKQIISMIERDSSGLLTLMFTLLLLGFVIGFIASIIIVISFIPLIMSIVTQAAGYSQGYYSKEMAGMAVLEQVFAMLPFIVVLYYGFSVVGAAVNMVTINAVALWMRQFDVPNWGNSEDPLPQTATSAPINNEPPQNPFGEEPVQASTYAQASEPAATPSFVPEEVGEAASVSTFEVVEAEKAAEEPQVESFEPAVIDLDAYEEPAAPVITPEPEAAPAHMEASEEAEVIEEVIDLTGSDTSSENAE